MKKMVMQCLAVCLAVLVVGCMKVEQKVQINRDGSATLNYTYAMSEEMIAQMEQMAQMGGGDIDQASDMSFDEQEIEKAFEGLSEKGFTLNSVRSWTEDGWKYMTVNYSVKDFAALAGEDAFGMDGFSLAKNADGNYVLAQKGGLLGQDEQEDMPPEARNMMMQQMLPMFAGMRIAFEISVPTDIVESSGQISGKTASWIYDVDKDHSFLLDDPPAIELVFSGKGLDLQTFGGE